jgi:hypothetical protein
VTADEDAVHPNGRSVVHRPEVEQEALAHFPDRDGGGSPVPHDRVEPPLPDAGQLRLRRIRDHDPAVEGVRSAIPPPFLATDPSIIEGEPPLPVERNPLAAHHLRPWIAGVDDAIEVFWRHVAPFLAACP